MRESGRVMAHKIPMLVSRLGYILRLLLVLLVLLVLRSHPVLGAEPGASHMCAKIHFHTYVDTTSVIYQKTMQ
jgi:hypothetical protein